MTEHDEMLGYYRQVTSVTDPGRYRILLMDWPDNIPALCKVVQGLVIHDLWVSQYGIESDVCDMPDGKLVVGGRAWQMCREEGYEPNLFGIGEECRGLWFVRGNLLRDLASLNKEETVPYLVGRPWDPWEIMAKADQAMTEEDLELLDRVASVTQCGNEVFGAIRSIYEANPELQPPPRWVCDMQALWFKNRC
jgi:hypothetical protein